MVRREKMKFLTEEWCAEFEAKLTEAFSAEKTPTKMTLSLCEGFGAVPQLGGKDIWYKYTLENGVLVKIEKGFGMDTAPAADYVSFADYEIVRKIMTGDMGIAKALLGGKIKLKGNVTKAIKMLDTYNLVQETKSLGGTTEW